MEEEDEEEEVGWLGAKRRGETPLYLLLPLPSSLFLCKNCQKGERKGK